MYDFSLATLFFLVISSLAQVFANPITYPNPEVVNFFKDYAVMAALIIEALAILFLVKSRVKAKVAFVFSWLVLTTISYLCFYEAINFLLVIPRSIAVNFLIIVLAEAVVALVEGTILCLASKKDRKVFLEPITFNASLKASLAGNGISIAVFFVITKLFY